MTTKKNFSVNPKHGSSESLLKDIRRNTKRIFTSEQKVLIVMWKGHSTLTLLGK